MVFPGSKNRCMLAEGHHETWETLHLRQSQEDGLPKGRSLIDNACQSIWQIDRNLLGSTVSGTTEEDRNRNGKQRVRAPA